MRTQGRYANKLHPSRHDHRSTRLRKRCDSVSVAGRRGVMKPGTVIAAFHLEPLKRKFRTIEIPIISASTVSAVVIIAPPRLLARGWCRPSCFGTMSLQRRNGFVTACDKERAAGGQGGGSGPATICHEWPNNGRRDTQGQLGEFHRSTAPERSVCWNQNATASVAIRQLDRGFRRSVQRRRDRGKLGADPRTQR